MREFLSYIAIVISSIAGVVSILNYIEKKIKRRSNPSQGKRRFK